LKLKKTDLLGLSYKEKIDLHTEFEVLIYEFVANYLYVEKGMTKNSLPQKIQNSFRYIFLFSDPGYC